MILCLAITGCQSSSVVQSKAKREASAKKGEADLKPYLPQIAPSVFYLFASEEDLNLRLKRDGDETIFEWNDVETGGIATAITEDGYLITAAHSVAQYTSALGMVNNSLALFPARIVAHRVSRGYGGEFAIIHISKQIDSPVELGELDPTDSRIYSIAFDRESIQWKLLTLSGQIIGEPIRIPGEEISAFPTDLPARPGDSGGGVLTAKGQLVGVVTRVDAKLIPFNTERRTWVCIPDKDLILSIIEEDRAKQRTSENPPVHVE